MNLSLSYCMETLTLVNSAAEYISCIIEYTCNTYFV